MRDDLYGGLRNALERGESLEKAVRSFINAGYNEAEVREAANLVSYGGSQSNFSENNKVNLPLNNKEESWPIQKSELSKSYSTPSSSSSQIQIPSRKEVSRIKNKIDYKLIILGFILFILIIVLLMSFFFREKIIEIFSGLL